MVKNITYKLIRIIIANYKIFNEIILNKNKFFTLKV